MQNPKIIQSISDMGYVVILHEIASILTTEISHQNDLEGNLDNVSIYINKMNAMNRDDDVAINVYIGKVDIDNKDIVSATSEVFYYIDVFANTLSDSSEEHYTKSGRLRDKYMSYIYYILNSSHYKVLDNKDLVKRTNIHELKNQDYTYDGDAYASMVGRLNFKVLINESHQMDKGVVLESVYTETTINNVKGFKNCLI